MEKIGKLGFGLMRLPMKDGVTDIEQTKEMVDLFMEAGFNYFDTAWAYGGSEDAVRQAITERYPRDSFILATKNAAWINCKTKEEAYSQFDVSLERTGAGYFDYYLLHNLGEHRSRYFDDFYMWNWISGKKAAGLIKHMGFSFHSTPEELDKILTAHPETEFVQLQLNYADWDDPSVRAGECYEVARKHGKSVIIMEPVKGGMLATPPESAVKIFKEAEPESSPASWALRFAASLEGVMTVLSGMSSTEQMKDNISAMKGFTGLTEKQAGVIDKVRRELAGFPLIPCTSCNYCAKVCPKNIGISGYFVSMNYLTLYGNLAAAKRHEFMLVNLHGKSEASECIGCGKCEEACPQHISIRAELEKAGKVFGNE